MKMTLTIAAVASLVLIQLPASAQTQGGALVIITECKGIDEISAHTARRILADALRAERVAILEAPELDRIAPIDDALRAEVQRLGAQGLYELRLTTLGKKIVVELEQRDSALASVRSRRLTAMAIEELDLVLPRLAKALVGNVSENETARIATVTAQEGRKWEKMPGEFLWGFGFMPGAPMADHTTAAYGLNLRLAYEMENLRLNADFGGMWGSGDSYDGHRPSSAGNINVGVSYLTSTEAWSPYFGGGLGWTTITVDEFEGDGLGLTLHAGLEFFRTHGARLMVEAGVVLPFFEARADRWDSQSEKTVYAPVGYGMIAVLW